MRSRRLSEAACRRGALRALIACGGLLALAGAQRRAAANSFPALGDAGLLARGSYVVGLVSQTRVGLDELLELDTQLGWWLFLSPHLQLRIKHLDSRQLRLSSSIGLSTPTPAMRLLKGYLFPSWETSGQNVGWFVVPEIGIAASSGARLVLGARVTLAVGLGVGPNAAGSLDTYAPIELLFAPALNGFRVSMTATADYLVLRWLRARIELSLHAIGEGDPPRSPWIGQVSVAGDVALGRRWRLSAGLAIYNYDQRAQEVVRGEGGRFERRAVRSTDVFPTLDVVFVSAR
jgi:hypothetical protein